MVPFSPGGATDVVGRLWAEKMKPVLGTVVTENRGGGGGVTGASEVARAQPDGHTFLFGNTSTQVLIPVIMSRPPYDALKDFVGIYTKSLKFYSPFQSFLYSTWRTKEVRHVGSDTIAPGFRCAAATRRGEEDKGRPQARRLLALAAIYDGATRTEAAKIGGVGLQIIRDWVLRFNARGPDGLLDGKSPGQPSKLNNAQREAVARMIESGPIPAVHGVVRWRLIDLAQWIFEEFRITIAKQTLSRELRAMGYRISQPGHVTMPRPRARLRILKKLSLSPT